MMNNLRDPLQRQGMGMIIGLSVQYLLGMLTNFFVTFPESGNEKTMWESARSQLVFDAHLFWGFLLLLGAIVFYIQAFRRKNRIWKIASGLALASIIFAFLAGVSFVDTQSDTYSLVMAIFFLTALISYGWGLYKTKN